MLKISITFFCLLISFAFSSQNNVPQKNWISISYSKCLEKELPCECQNKEIYSFIYFDTNRKTVTIPENIVYDANLYAIKKTGKNDYFIYEEKYLEKKFKDTTIIIGTLKVLNDTLYYTNNVNKKIAFVSYGNNTEDEREYYHEHIKQLNKALLKHQNPTLETILKQNSLTCNCNPELGTINLVSGNKNAWVLEKRGNSLFIYKWTNIQEVKTIDLKIEKKLIKTVKFN